MRVEFIGLGQMGSGMAENLIKAGHEVTVYNRTRDKEQTLLDRGAVSAIEIADACRGVAVFSMLADDRAVEGVVYGDQGILAHLPKGPSIFHQARSALRFRSA